MNSNATHFRLDGRDFHMPLEEFIESNNFSPLEATQIRSMAHGDILRFNLGTAGVAVLEMCAIPNPGWEQLKAFRVLAYPDDLTVLTNADEGQVREALDSMDGEVPLATVLNNFGFYAVVGNTTNITVKSHE